MVDALVFLPTFWLHATNFENHKKVVLSLFLTLMANASIEEGVASVSSVVFWLNFIGSGIWQNNFFSEVTVWLVRVKFA
jgi:hypothetical protein